MQISVDQANLPASVFQDIAEIAYKESGLLFAPEKKPLVQSRLRHRLRVLGYDDFETYSKYVKSSEGKSELRYMISALTTNVTHFFREPHHFDLMSQRMGRQFATKARLGQPIRIWSAGCSNGQEPYSIAMHVLTKHPELEKSDFRVLATDIDPRVVEFGKSATYTHTDFDKVPAQLRDNFMEPVPGSTDVQVKNKVRNVVTFKELNLLSSWPMQRKFDAIFCRNVVIYFDLKTQDSLWPRFVNALTPEGILLLGHSERVSDPQKFNLCPIGPTAFAQSSQNTDNV